MRTNIFTIFVAAATLLPAQEKAPPAPPHTAEMVSAVIPVKTLTGDAFERLTKLLSAFKANFSADDRLRVIVVYAPKDVVDQMKRVVQELDRPGSEAAVGRNIDLTLSFLRCFAKAGPEGTPAPLPAELESVAKQLRAATQCKNVQLWDVLPVRIQEGKSTEQTARLSAKELGMGDSPGAPMLTLKLYPEAVTQKADGRAVRFSRFNVGLRLPYVSTPIAGHKQYNFMDVGLNTSGDFKEGQKTVIGKMGLDDDSAVFVVVALKVLD